METETYDVEAQVQRNHWWFVGRRRLFAKEIERIGLSKNQAVLDIGTSTGTNLRMLRDEGFTNFRGADFSELAIAYCAKNGFDCVDQASITDLPYPDNSFDLILCTDVLEHIDEDERALRELLRVLNDDGSLLVTVPAFNSLWGLQDDVSQHHRRYLKPELLSKVKNAGFTPGRSYYFNYLLFGPIWAARQIIRRFDIKLSSENQLNTPLINKLLSWLFFVDVTSAPFVRAPFGVSVFLIAQKK